MLYIILLIICGSSFVRNLVIIVFTHCTSLHLYSSIVKAVIRAKGVFFQLVPMSWIISVFAKDIGVIDHILPMISVWTI